MGLFTNLMQQMEAIDRQGIDLMKESYTERMKGMPNPVNPPKYRNLSAGKSVVRDAIQEQMSRVKTSGGKGSDVSLYNPAASKEIKDTEDGKIVLDREKLETDISGKEDTTITRLDWMRENESNMYENIEVVGSGGDKKYLAKEDMSELSDYYNKASATYDALGDEYDQNPPAGLERGSDKGQRLVKQNRSNLKYWLDNFSQDVYDRAGYPKGKEEFIKNEFPPNYFD